MQRNIGNRSLHIGYIESVYIFFVNPFGIPEITSL